MERVGIDALYILIATDSFRTWPEAYHLQDQEAGTIVAALLEGIFSRFITPEVIHTDQGRKFKTRTTTL